MTTWNNVSRKWCAARSTAVFGAAMALAACGGGGVTTPKDDGGGGPSVDATPYTLFASNYVAYATQTNGAFLHSVQGGDVYANFGGNINYGCYSFNQGAMNATQFYAIQAQANSNGGPPDGNNCQPNSNIPPTTAADFALVSIKAPGTNSPNAASVAPLDISQSTSDACPDGQHLYAERCAGCGRRQCHHLHRKPEQRHVVQPGRLGARLRCVRADQELAVIGRSAEAPLGVLNYVIPFDSFTCTVGTMDTMKSTGVTSVTVGFSGDKNPDLQVNELDVIAVGYVGFTQVIDVPAWLQRKLQPGAAFRDGVSMTIPKTTAEAAK